MAMPDPGKDEDIRVTDPEDEKSDDIDLSTLPEEVQKKVQSLSAQRAAHKEKRQKAEQLAEERGKKLAELEAELTTLKTPKTVPAKEPERPAHSSPSDAEWRERMDFLVRHRDFSAEELDELTAIAKGKGVSLEDAVKTPVWSAFASARKLEQEKASAAIQGTSASDKISKDMELTDEHKAMAKKFGVSEESFKKTLLKRTAGASQ